LAIAVIGGGIAVNAAQRLPVLQRQEPLAVVHANVVNTRDGSILPDVTVTIRGNRIESIGRGRPAADARVIDVEGAYVLPGLIDGHTHLSSIEAGKRAVESGVTTVRSAGMGGGLHADVGLRELARSASLAAPEVFATGYILRPRLPVDIFLLKPEYASLDGGLDTVESVRNVVKMNLAHRVDWIKIMVTEGIGGDPERLQFTERQVIATVDEARRRGTPVAAHAFSDQGVRLAVQAGVRSIEHGSLVSEETLDLMKRRGTYLVPTTDIIFVAGKRPAPPGIDEAIVRRNLLTVEPRGREAVRHARARGVKIVAGTDWSYTSDEPRGVSSEIANLVELGLTPLEALQSATIVAAEMLDRQRSIGSIETGYEADVIAVQGNPLSEVRSLRAPVLVISNGRIAKPLSVKQP
jgi:imidazolonepropionase-like amidohydrolase